MDERTVLPEVRDGWLYARGVADDKGQLWALLRAAADLAAKSELPVNVRFCCDGEEEIGGTSIVEFLDAHVGEAEACVIFDTAMLDDGTPVFTIATRGTLYVHVEVRTGERDLHSGVYGGAALNALHVLAAALANVLPRDGRLPEPLQAGVRAPTDVELQGWTSLPAGVALLEAQGAAPADRLAAEEFYLRTWALPSLDVNGIEGGSPVLQKTIVTSSARANLSLRLASGQTVTELAPILRGHASAEPARRRGADGRSVASCDPGHVAADRARSRSPGTHSNGRRASGRSFSRRRLIADLPLLERLGIPAVVTGFDVPGGNIHAPNERMLLTHLALAVAAARETFLAFAEL